MRNSKNLAVASVFMALLAFSACQKSDTSSFTAETTLATDNARMDNESDNIGAVVSAVALSNGMSNVGGKLEGPGGGLFGNITLPACATVTVDTVSATKSISIDFGSSPCLCDQWDGRYRQGVIKATWTGSYRQPGTVITTTTQNYYRGDTPDQMDKYDITKTVTNMGPNNANNLVYHIVETITVSYFDGTTANFNYDKLKEWTQGESTADTNDDVFSITGGGNGTNRDGVQVTAVITTPIMKNACQWYVSGVVKITRANLPIITLDYGNGNCDNTATLSVNGQSKTITLK